MSPARYSPVGSAMAAISLNWGKSGRWSLLCPSCIRPSSHCSPSFSDLVSSLFSELHRCSIPTHSIVTLGLTITSGGRVEERRPDPAPGSDRRRLRPGRPRDDDLDLLPARRIEGRLSP